MDIIAILVCLKAVHCTYIFKWIMKTVKKPTLQRIDADFKKGTSYTVDHLIKPKCCQGTGNRPIVYYIDPEDSKKSKKPKIGGHLGRSR